MQLGEVGLLHLNLRELHLPQGNLLLYVNHLFFM